MGKPLLIRGGWVRSNRRPGTGGGKGVPEPESLIMGRAPGKILAVSQLRRGRELGEGKARKLSPVK
jgi:hypothetical protein